MLKARIGLYSAGLNTYWAQFAGLKDRLLGYNSFIAERLSQVGEVYNFGLVDDETAGRQAGEYFNAHNVDIIFAHSATYFTSSTVLPVHQICKAPAVWLNLQPTPQMNYAKTGTGEWLAHCVGCPVPEASNAFERAGIPFHVVNGLLGLEKTPEISVTDEVTAHMPQAQKAWAEILEWARAAQVKRAMAHARFGFLGNNYSGMLDMYSDFTMLQAQLGHARGTAGNVRPGQPAEQGHRRGSGGKAGRGGAVLHHQRRFPSLIPLRRSPPRNSWTGPAGWRRHRSAW